MWQCMLFVICNELPIDSQKKWSESVALVFRLLTSFLLYVTVQDLKPLPVLEF